MNGKKPIMTSGRLQRLFLMLALVSLLLNSCKHKPAYSDIQPDQTGRNQPAPTATQSASESAPAAPDESQAVKPDQPIAAQPEATPAGQPNEAHRPDFVDPRTGQFKDLPGFPAAMRTYAQIGPINGVEAGLLLYETTAPFSDITAFYDKAIKQNGWSIVGNTRDAEYFKWELKKGKTSEALVEVKSDSKSNRKGITLSRAERPEGK